MEKKRKNRSSQYVSFSLPEDLQKFSETIDLVLQEGNLTTFINCKMTCCYIILYSLYCIKH